MVSSQASLSCFQVVILFLFSQVFILTSPPTLVDASSLAATTDMVWNDEFTSLTRTNWNVATSDKFIPSSGIQSFTSDNVAITDRDYLTITTTKSSSSSTFESGQIDSFSKVHFQYCTVVARIKVPNTTTGIVPTFYTQGVNNTESNMAWPSNGEIDIMKVGQGNASATGSGNERTVSGIHYINEDGNYYSNTGSRDCGADLSSSYYVYTMDWTPTSITTFYNDRQVWSADIVDCKDNNDCNEFHQPHFMIFHTSVGGSFPSVACDKQGASSASGGTIPNTCSTNDQLSAQDITATVPASMYVDWVRIYDNGNCQLTVVDNDGSTNLPNTPATSPVTTDTGSSNEVPIGSSTGGSAGSPAGWNSGNTPGLSPTTSNTAPGGGSSPVGSDSGTKYTFPPNLTPIGSDTGNSGGLSPTGTDSGSSGGLSPTGTDSGNSGGLSPTGSDSGGSEGLSPTGSDSGGSGGLSPTGSVTGPAGSAPVPIVSIPIPPAPVTVPVVPPANPPVTPPVASPVIPPATPRPVQPPVVPPVAPPTVSVVQPPAVSVVGDGGNSDKSKGKKKCKEKKVPGVISGDGSSSVGKGEGKGGSTGSSGVTGDGSSSVGKGEGKGGSSTGVTTGDSDSNVFAPSPSSTSGSNVDGDVEGKAGYRYHQRQRRTERVIASKQNNQRARRKDQQVITPNSVGGGNNVNSTNTGVGGDTAVNSTTTDVVGPDDEELECEDVDANANALSVESNSRISHPLVSLTLTIITTVGFFFCI